MFFQKYNSNYQKKLTLTSTSKFRALTVSVILNIQNTRRLIEWTFDISINFTQPNLLLLIRNFWNGWFFTNSQNSCALIKKKTPLPMEWICAHRNTFPLCLCMKTFSLIFFIRNICNPFQSEGIMSMMCKVL